MGSLSPQTINTGRPSSDGSVSGMIGTMGANKAAASNTSGRKRRLAAAMFAPLLKPSAILRVSPKVEDTKSANS